MTNAVLILDDDIDLTSALAELVKLYSQRHTIMVSSFAELKNLGEAIFTCSLAFLDVNLGHNQPSGIVAAKWLREQGFKGRMLFFTGHAGNHPLVIEASTVAGVEIIHKPIDNHQLREILISGTK
jgi:FixJ family two-component response regulator